MSDYCSHPALLQSPTKRAAYSDRTSYVMAEMARLAYFRFEGGSYLIGEGNKVRLKYSVGMYDRFIWWTKQFKNLFRGEFQLLSDHGIDT